jgi:16S rRNA A1518/A1519 N6-dimethyltransferase RsmA/KsgA/DIM1 with predicted DNA glycosylase/AP lyase activity
MSLELRVNAGSLSDPRLTVAVGMRIAPHSPAPDPNVQISLIRLVPQVSRQSAQQDKGAQR